MTTTDGSDLLRFAVFCKKCSLYDENKCSRRVGQNAPKLGISRQFERRKNNDSSTFRMPRHSSFMIMHTFADWGNTGQNKAEGKGDTTDLTTDGARMNA